MRILSVMKVLFFSYHFAGAQNILNDGKQTIMAQFILKYYFNLILKIQDVTFHIMRDDVLQRCPRLIDGRRSAQVSDYQEHEDAGQQHSSDHDELVLGGSPLYQSHHCIGQPQHVGHIQHLLMCPLCTVSHVLD